MADDIVDPFEGIVDPFASNGPKAPEAPKPGSTWARAITDIPTEIGKEFTGAKEDVTALGRRSEMGPVEGLLATGKAALAPVRAGFAIPVGAARSVLGHGLASTERAIGENVINPIAERFGAKPQHPDYEEMYEKAKGDVDTALAAARPRAPVAPAPTPPPIDRFGVTLTEGERTGNLAARQAEQAALRGQAGAPAQHHAEEFFNQQRPEQLQQARSDVARELDPVGRQELVQTPTEAAEMGQQALQREFGRSKQGVSSEYQRAKDLGGDINTDFFDNFTYNIKNNLTNRPSGAVVVNERTPNAANMVDYLNDRIASLRIRNDLDPLNPMGAENGNIVIHGPQGNLIRARPAGVSLEGVEEWRKTLSQMRGDALAARHNNPADFRAAQGIMDEFDNEITRAVNSGAFNGDPAAVRAWNNARAAHAEHMKKFGNDAVGRRLRDIIGDGRFEDPASLNTVADYFFGSGVKAPEVNVAMAKRVKKILGEDSPEWAALRQGMYHRIVSTAEGVNERGPGALANRLSNFLNGAGSDMAAVFFSPAQRQLLNEYSELHRTLSIPLQGANWPNTAAGVIPHIKKATGHILGAIGAAVGHAVSPIVGGAVGFGLGEGIGYGLRAAENSRNLRQTASQLPLVGQRLRQWQQAQFAASTKASLANDARKAVATNQLALALERIGVGHDAVLRLLASGPQSTGPSEAKENRIEVPVYKEGRAAGGRVSFADGGVPTFDERFTGTSPDNPSADDMVDFVQNKAAQRYAPQAPWEEREARLNLAAQQAQPVDNQGFMDQLKGIWGSTKDAAKRFAQYDRQFTEDVLNLPRRAYEHSDDLKKGLKNLLGMGEEERYQLWPEKMIRSGASLPHDVMSGEVPQYEMDPKTGEWHTSTPMIERTQDLAGMAGSGGLGAGATDATLGSAPFLRPALKYEGKIYKAPMGGQHLDAIPKDIYPEFQRQAMSGEDISNFNFGFMNHKGHFLDREAALDYAVKEGLIDPRDAQQGALTTTLLSDTQKPGSVLSALEHQGQKANPYTVEAYHGSPQQFEGNKIKSLAERMHPEDAADEIAAGRLSPDFLEFYSTDNKNLANRYATDSWITRDTGRSHVMPLKLDTKDYKVIDAKGKNYSEMRPEIEAAKKDGAKGITLKNLLDNPENQGIGSEPPSTVHVSFDPGTVRSKFAQFDPKENGKPGLLLSDTSKPGSAIAGLAKSAEPFYSATERALEGATQQKMHGVQWANWLKNQPGVKPDELQYTGIDNWLREQKGPITKEQVQDYLKENKVVVNDVVKSETRSQEDFAKINKFVDDKVEDFVYDQRNSGRNPTHHEIEEYRDKLTEHVVDHPEDYGLQRLGTKYHTYQLPGGENYREHLLTLPDRIKERFLALDKKAGEGNATDADWAEIDKIQREHPRVQSLGKDTNEYKSPHWDEPNVLAHVRTNDRDVGGVPSLHLDEIQSDLHQEGRKKGYKGDKVDTTGWTVFRTGEDAAVKDRSGKIINWYGQDRNSPMSDQQLIEKGAKDQQWANDQQAVPNFPFKTSWAELALKRMIRTAAEEGKSRISWTPGEAQAARYDLSKQVDNVGAVRREDGTFMLNAMPKGGGTPYVLGQRITEDKLSDIVGKDLAEKISKQTREHGTKIYKANDLKVGGEGMKGFYDQMLPKMVEKLGKKYGVKVKQGQSSKDIVTGLDEKPQEVYYFDIPEKMKEDVLTKGFPLFSDTGHSAPITAHEKKEEVRRPRQQEKSKTEINTPERASGGRVVASNINHSPSEAQKAAGNYAKDHVNIQGLDITIENARGKERNGVGKNGKPWSVRMPAHYGYVKQTEGADGDHVDVYLGPHIRSKHVFVVNQIDADTKEFDEHKAILGVANLRQALDIYQHGFSDGKGLQRIGSIVPTDMSHFKVWLKSPHTKKPFKLNA